MASPNDLIREGLTAILVGAGFDVVGAADKAVSLNISEDESRVLIVIDHFSPQELVRSTEAILSAHDNVDVVIVTDEFDLAATLDCFHAGARGVIVRSTSSKPLVTALRLVALGEKVFPSQMLEMLDWNSPAQGRPQQVETEIANANLSPRELEVLCCLMAGYPNKLIARELDVCEATVKVHVKAILRKLNVRNRTQAAIWASAHHLSGNEEVAAHA
ncbi:LuxR C-terminal-related transcriptional regulator [Altererythrobacter sp. CAU 1778]